MLLFFDVETTGLEPERCRIIQVAAVATTDTLQVIGQFCRDVRTEMAVLLAMPPAVKEMHARTGLLERLSGKSGIACQDLAEVESDLEEFCDVHFAADLVAIREGDRSRKIVLAGDSIHFDRSFVRLWMPRFERLLHHRMVDVSAFRVLAERWGRQPFDGSNPMEHDALSDCRTSIAKLDHWRRNFFRRDESPGAREFF